MLSFLGIILTTGHSAEKEYLNSINKMSKKIAELEKDGESLNLSQAQEYLEQILKFNNEIVTDYETIDLLLTVIFPRLAQAINNEQTFEDFQLETLKEFT